MIDDASHARTGPVPAIPGATTQREAGPLADAPVRVVVADDTPDIRLLLRVALGRIDGFEVVGEAADGAEAVRLAQRERPDAILLDLAMPVMDGLQAIPEIARVSPSTRIVVLTGFDRSGTQEAALRRGAHAYLEKGRPLDELVDTLRRVCGRPGAARAPERPARAPTGEALPDLSELLSTLGHELSSPVAVVSGFASMLLREVGQLDRDRIADYARAIARSGQQLTDLINAFYDARHLGSGGLPVERTDVALGALVRDTVHDLAAAVAPHPLVLEAVVDGTTTGDPLRLRQALGNLLLNAARFSPPTAPVTVAMARAGGDVEIAVIDRCGGIPPEQRGRLFAKFAKVRQGGPGLGLGLYISRGIARAHGGDLVYAPLSDGDCRFVLRVPVTA